MSDIQIALENDDLMPIKKFAAKIGVNLRTLYRMIDDREVPKPFKQRGKNYYSISDLPNYRKRINSQRP